MTTEVDGIVTLIEEHLHAMVKVSGWHNCFDGIEKHMCTKVKVGGGHSC